MTARRGVTLTGPRSGGGGGRRWQHRPAAAPPSETGDPVSVTFTTAVHCADCPALLLPHSQTAGAHPSPLPPQRPRQRGGGGDAACLGARCRQRRLAGLGVCLATCRRAARRPVQCPGTRPCRVGRRRRMIAGRAHLATCFVGNNGEIMACVIGVVDWAMQN